MVGRARRSKVSPQAAKPDRLKIAGDWVAAMKKAVDIKLPERNPLRRIGGRVGT